MATSGESASNWLKNKKPASGEVEKILEKLLTRIESWSGDDHQIQGSIEAADVLQHHLSSIKAPVNRTNKLHLDLSNLIPEHAPISLDNEEKRKAFAELKTKFGTPNLG